MKILITGGSGFVGRHVAARLKSANHELCSLGRTDLSQREPHIWKRSFIADFAGPFEIPELSDFEAVVHLAGHAHQTDDAFIHEAVNFSTTRDLISASTRSHVSHFVFLSSIAVYGGAASMTESLSPKPNSNYGRSKLRAEEVIAQITNGTDTAYTILRPPLIYGPRAPGNFPTLVNWVKKGFLLPIGNFDSRRSFLYVENLADVIVKCLEDVRSRNKVFNVSDRETVTTAEFVGMIAQGLSKPSPVLSMPTWFVSGLASTVGQSQRLKKLVGASFVDTGEIRRCLNWSPPYQMADAVKISVARS